MRTKTRDREIPTIEELQIMMVKRELHNAFFMGITHAQLVQTLNHVFCEREEAKERARREAK